MTIHQTVRIGLVTVSYECPEEMGGDHVIRKSSAIKFPTSSVCSSRSAPTRSSPQWNMGTYLQAHNPLPINHQSRILNTINVRYPQVYQPGNDPLSKRYAQFNHHLLPPQSTDRLPLILLNGAPSTSVIIIGVHGGCTLRVRMVGIMGVPAIR